MIPSPFITNSDKKEIAFEYKLKNLFEQEKVEGAFIFYIPRKGNVSMYDIGLCGHQLATLAECIAETAEKRLKHDKC